MEVIWKAVLGVLNCWIGVAVYFQNKMHGLRSDRGTGTSSLGFKLLQHLTEMKKEVLYEVLLDQ